MKAINSLNMLRSLALAAACCCGAALASKPGQEPPAKADAKQQPLGVLLLKLDAPQLACTSKSGAAVINLGMIDSVSEAAKDALKPFAIQECTLMIRPSMARVIGLFPDEGVLEISVDADQGGGEAFLPMNIVNEKALSFGMVPSQEAIKHINEAAKAADRAKREDQKGEKKPGGASPERV